jgi:hypothetical protein
MENGCCGNSAEEYDINDIISEKEREHLLYGLQRFLVWVGEPIPDEITIHGQTLRLHDMIWKLINIHSLSEPEREWVHELIILLEQKEEVDKQCIEKANLTPEKARQCFNEAAGLLRAIMDLKDLESGRIKKDDFDKVSTKDKVNDARQWVKFIEKMQH